MGCRFRRRNPRIDLFRNIRATNGGSSIIEKIDRRSRFPKLVFGERIEERKGVRPDFLHLDEEALAAVIRRREKTDGSSEETEIGRRCRRTKKAGGERNDGGEVEREVRRRGARK